MGLVIAPVQGTDTGDAVQDPGMFVLLGEVWPQCSSKSLVTIYLKPLTRTELEYCISSTLFRSTSFPIRYSRTLAARATGRYHTTWMTKVRPWTAEKNVGPLVEPTNLLHSAVTKRGGFFSYVFYKDHLYSSISSYCWKRLICSLLVPNATTSWE
jgi:hypothetical protein